MFDKVQAMWRVFWGKPLIYKAILQRLVLPASYDLLVLSNTWVGEDPAEYLQVGDDAWNVVTAELLGEEDLS